MFLQGLVYFCAVLMAEYGLFRRLWTILCRSKRAATFRSQVDADIKGEQVDSDVLEEEKRITETPLSSLKETDLLVLKVLVSNN